MEAFEALIAKIATALGAITIFVPVLVVLMHARRPKGRSSGRARASRSWPGVLLISIGFVALGFLLWKPLPLLLSTRLALVLSLLGGVFYFPGVGLYLWGFFTLGAQFGVSGVLGADLYQDHKLVTSGPFAILRHPMYAGVLLAAVGAFLIFRTWVMVLFTPMSLVVLARAGREETLLAEEFGEIWQAYATKVPKWLPRIRRSIY
jgi:protein-S-isoprenylcysteine O-methyltransferase Ste14